MALKIDEIMDLSLDDYIAISKKATNNAVTNGGKGNDAKFGRRKGNIDDEEEDDEDDFPMQPPKKEELIEETNIKEVNSDIWKGPDSSVSYLDCNDHRNDLREKLNNNINKQSAKISMVQYRMMAPNNSANRPRGLPTLLPLDCQVNNRNWVHNKGNRRNAGNRGNHGYGNFQRGNNAGNGIYNNNGPGNGGGLGVSNGRVQKNRKQDFESFFTSPNTSSKNLRFSVARNNSSQNNLNESLNSTYATAQNMIIETPSNYINLVPSPPLNSSFQMPKHAAMDRHYNTGSQTLPIVNLTPQAEAVLNLNSMGVQNNSLLTSGGSSNESLKSLLGFQGNVSSEMMPIFASRLLDYIQNGLQNPVVHKPIYDMKIQKDIHEIQKKPLLYKCPGGEVVSSDGAGVNCKIIPRTSGVSLNCRFA